MLVGTGAEGRGPATAGGAESDGRRPHLDGLRAVAVYLVVAFHAGVGQLAGGFVGVDVFFVLSGYLVTGLLLADLRAGDGVDLARFYSRRARRLLPAAALTLVATAAVYPLVANAAEVADSRSTLWGAATGLANWVFLSRSTDYFAADVAGDPVLHFWSLAVEEQFYLVWPLLLLGLWRVVGRLGRPGRALTVVLATAAVAGAGWAAVVAMSSPSRAHFATDARAYQLLAGAALASLPLGLVRRGAAVLAPLALGGVVVLASPRVPVGPTTRGLAVTMATLALLAALESGPSVARWVLDRRPVVLLGQVSYGTYLWHWLVVIVLARTVEVGPLGRAALTAVVATALAVLSAQLVELPIRSSPALDRRARAVLAVVVPFQVLLAVVALPALSDGARGDDGTEVAVEVEVGSGTPTEGIDWEAGRDDQERFPYCEADDVAACTVRRGSGTHVLLLGDSHAEMLVPAVLEVADEADLTVSVALRSTCPWVRGVGFLLDGFRDCFDRQDQWYEEILPALDPDVVIATHRPTDDPASPVTLVFPDGSVAEAGDSDLPARVRGPLDASLRDLVAIGARVLVLEPTPVAPNDRPTPVECLSAAEVVEACRFVQAPTPTPLEQAERDAVGRLGDDVVVADVDPLVCPYTPICDPVVDGTIVLRDQSHVTARRARGVADELLALLQDQGWVT